jgi:hypothetical protein
MFNGNRFASSFKKVLIAAGVVAAFGAGSGQAYAATHPVFSFNPTVFGTVSADQEGDKITGNYFENFIITGPGTFNSNGFVILNTISDENDNPILPIVSGLGVTYGMYANYFANGTFVVDGSGAIHFTVTAAGADLYADDGNNNFLTYDTNPVGGYAQVVPDGDDALLATADLLSGDGDASATLDASGNFGITFNPVSLTNNLAAPQCTPVSGGVGPGCQFFTQPRPFYIQANFSGQFIDFDLVSPQTISGSADLIFEPSAVPEPASLTLLGLGLVGIARRRFQSKKQA